MESSINNRQSSIAGGRRRLPVVAAVALLVATGGFAAWWALSATRAGGIAGATPGAARGYNVLLITLDTLRADHLGCYGYDRIETPVMDGLAADGVRFAQAATAVPMTLPAHATILTGLYPPRHGVRDNGTYRLLPEQETLAETLQRRGYATAGFIGAFVLDPRYGLDQGFDHYDANLSLRYRLPTPQPTSNPDRPANVVVDAALSWLGDWQSSADRKPFFAWVHLFDAHQPCIPPEPYRTRYADRLYDGEIAFVDAQVGRLMEGLRALGAADRTVVALIGDHGEGLGEHGEDTHRQLIYESTMRVPFIMWCPGVIEAGRVFDRSVVATVDLVPTLLELVGLEGMGSYDGRSLLSSRIDPGRAVYLETLSPQLNDGWAPLFGVRRLHDKYIEAPTPEYYDLGADPGELNNLLVEREADAYQLAEMLSELAASFPAASDAATVTPTPEEIERLAALGYVVGSGGVGADQASDLDPKVMILSAKERLRGIHLIGQGKPREAIAILEKEIGRCPGASELWSSLAHAQMMIGETEAAIRSGRRSVELRPDKPERWFGLARQYLTVGDAEQAEVCLVEGERLDPNDGAGHLIRAGRAISEGRLDDALSHCAQAVERDPVRCAAKGNALIGTVHARKGDAGRAAAAFETALGMGATGGSPASAVGHDPRNGTALLGLARILAERGDRPRAIELLQLIIEGQAEFLDAGRLMGRLYFEQGQPQVAVSILRVVTQGRPSDGEAHYQLSRALASQALVDAALHHLELAASLGAVDFDSLRNDGAFAILLSHPRVEALERAAPDE